jgi:hypothetical protein
LSTRAALKSATPREKAARKLSVMARSLAALSAEVNTVVT